MLRINKNTTMAEPPKFDREKEYMPKSGMLGTEYVGSDRYSVICISVDSPKRITLKRLWGLDENLIAGNGDIMFGEEGEMYMTEADWHKDVYCAGKDEKWSLRGNKGWRKMGESTRSSSIHWGIASPYRDPSF